MGNQLEPFKAPNPQEIQFSSSKLYELDGKNITLIKLRKSNFSEKLERKEVEDAKKLKIEELKYFYINLIIVICQDLIKASNKKN